jgi:hypothetical protein
VSTRKKAGTLGKKPETTPAVEGQRQLPPGLTTMFTDHSFERADALKEIPKKSLEKLGKHKGSLRDWANIQFRLAFGLFLVKAVLEMEDEAASVVLPLNEAVLVNRAVMHRAKMRIANKHEWAATPMEVEMIDEGLDYINQIQDQVTPEEIKTAFENAKQGFETSMLSMAIRMNKR